MVFDFDVGINESIFFDLFCKPNDTYEWPKVLLNVDYNAKIVIESDLCTNVHIFELYLCTIGHRFTQMIAYFLVMNSKIRCIIKSSFL